ncbi:MAG: sigma-70 family RNA polymerase sigma factor [Bacteroidales bacterium]|nr:sigma-70 family RNA polymerase sigma factor [Bacteroidales bacterium]
MTGKGLTINESQYWEYAATAVYGYARKTFGNFFTKEDYEDIIGEVVYKMYRYRDSYDPSKSETTTWVGTISRNAVHTWARNKMNRRGISQSMELGFASDGTIRTVETAGDLDTDRYLLYGDTLSGFNSSLSDENEKVLLSLKVDGFDTDEIAQMLGVPKSKVYSDWFKLKRKLSSAA